MQNLFQLVRKIDTFNQQTLKNYNINEVYARWFNECVASGYKRVKATV